MTDDPPGPPLGELRAASAGPMAASMLANMFPHALKAAVDRGRYLLDARTMGVDAEIAERVLGEVRDELLHIGYPPSDAPRIAYRRLADAEAGIEHPPEHVRTVARQALQLDGAAFDPQSVDRFARQIAPIVEPATDFTARMQKLTTSQGPTPAEIEALKAGILALAETAPPDEQPPAGAILGP